MWIQALQKQIHIPAPKLPQNMLGGHVPIWHWLFLIEPHGGCAGSAHRQSANCPSAKHCWPTGHVPLQVGQNVFPHGGGVAVAVGVGVDVVVGVRVGVGSGGGHAMPCAAALGYCWHTTSAAISSAAVSTHVVTSATEAIV